MTAGSGIVHSEMFPLLDRDGPNTLEMFQIWINLPAADKMIDAHFSMLWDRDIPRHVVTDDGGRVVEVTVIAGSLGAAEPPAPPPASWASRTEADVSIWHIVMDAGTTWTLPPAASAETVRTLYVLRGIGSVDRWRGDRRVDRCRRRRRPPTSNCRPSGRVEILVLQGRPLGEPVAQYGPFVMNTRAEIQQAFDDYQRTRFGGWPWDRDDPVHGADGRAVRPARRRLGRTRTRRLTRRIRGPSDDGGRRDQWLWWSEFSTTRPATTGSILAAMVRDPGEQRAELSSVDVQDDDVGLGGHRRVAGRVGQQRHLADEPAGTDVGDVRRHPG